VADRHQPVKSPEREYQFLESEMIKLKALPVSKNSRRKRGLQIIVFEGEYLMSISKSDQTRDHRSNIIPYNGIANLEPRPRRYESGLERLVAIDCHGVDILVSLSD